MFLAGVPLALLALGLLCCPNPAEASALSIEYSVSIRGLPVGTARLRSESADGRYRTEFSARVSGLARMFSDAEMSAHAAGDIAPDRPHPDEYGHVWVEDGETETVAMRFAGTAATEISLDPPRKRPERYEPVTAADKADVLDPVSAFLWPVAGGAGPESCGRTLPLIDGKHRFDIDLSFARKATFTPRNATAALPALVCSMRYRQISGHRLNRKGGGFMREDSAAEVWMAPAGDEILAPVQVSLESRVGRIVLRATKFEVE
jgi:hypothetical protein